MKRVFLIFIIFSLIISFAPARAQTAPGLLLPIGGGYSDIYAGFSQAAVANAKDTIVNILVLAPTYSTNPLQITDAERATNLKDANERRFQIEEACKRAAPPEITCRAILAPVFTRSDAEDPAILNLFSDNLAAVFILGGDQTVGMQVIIGTPVEVRLGELHRRGVIIGGTSAGGGMQSRAMLAGYNPNYAAGNSLSFGAVDVWNTPEKHGLTFGLQNAILDQHFHQRARFGRLLNAILLPGVPHLGVGVDAYTGVVSENEVLRDVFGLYTVTVLDADLYHAADGVKYVPVAENRLPLLSARNILVSLLAPGDSSYDLKNRTTRFAGKENVPQARLERLFAAFSTPAGAGALILAGDISDTLENTPILARFIALGGGENANLLVIADGSSSVSANERLAQKYADALIALGAKANIFVPDSRGIFGAPPAAEVTGLVLVSKDASKSAPPAWIKDLWLAGMPLLADNAAAALMGRFYSAHRATPGDAEEAELATQKSFWLGKTNIQPGLGLVNITIEPQLLADNRFGRWFSLAYNHPDLLALGLNANTAVELSPQGATAMGGNSIFLLDLRFANLGQGSNDGFVIANGMLDLFAPGETLAAEVADTSSVYEPMPTPVVMLTSPTPSPTPEPSATPTAQLTSVPESTPTALRPIPPREQESGMGSVIIASGLLAGVVGMAVFFALRRRQGKK